MGIRHVSEESLSFAGDSKKQEMNNTSRIYGKIADVPGAPTSPNAVDVGSSRAYNNGAATVSFTAPATGGTAASFTATSTPGSFTATGASSPLTVTGLQSATAYTFAVTATNTTGSITSAASGSMTASTVPATPSAPTATDSGSGSGRAYNNGAASVAFTAPASGGKSISSYTVTSTPGSLSTSGASSPLTISGLQSATSYTYSVTATNANGTSVASSASSAVTATTVPQAPTIGTVTDGGTGTTVSIPYTAGATGGSAITNYQFISSPATTTQTSTSNPYTFTGLTAGTAYTFTVQAINAQGTSAASSASNSVTPVVPSSFYLISSQAVSSGTSVTFSSIPSTYKSLQIRYSATNNTAGNGFVGVLNGDTGSNYISHALVGNNGAVSATSSGTTTSFWAGDTFQTGMQTGYPASAIIDIVDYASTAKNKTIKTSYGFNNNTSSQSAIILLSSLWISTAAITSVTIKPVGSAQFSTGSTFSLYGVS